MDGTLKRESLKRTLLSSTPLRCLPNFCVCVYIFCGIAVNYADGSCFQLLCPFNLISKMYPINGLDPGFSEHAITNWTS